MCAYQQDKLVKNIKHLMDFFLECFAFIVFPLLCLMLYMYIIFQKY